jgi:hypothetical protein
MGSNPLFGSGQWYHPSGQYGVYPACGCSSLLIIIAGIILVCAGCMGLFPSGYNYQ